MRRYAFDILGLRDEKAAGTASGRDYVTPLVEMLLDERLKARAAKDWAASDRIRDGLTAAGIRVKDRKDGTDWEVLPADFRSGCGGGACGQRGRGR